MAKQGASKVVPRLRFPAFEKTSGWSAKILGDEGDFLSPLTGKTAQHFGSGTANYVTYMNVFANTFTDMATLGTVHVGSDESQNAIEAGDVLFTVSSETPEEVGMSSVVLDAVPNCYVNSFCAMFRFAEGGQPNLRFLGYSLRQPYSRRHFVKRAQGSTRFNLSKAAFRSLPLALPSPPEQQKIADCLTSLDEVIAAQGQKVEALKAHKRGLMQQLFPREGETRPRVRFPEFRNAPKWDVKKLSALIDLVSGMHLSPDQYSSSGDVPYFTGPSDFTNDLKRVTKWATSSSSVAKKWDTLITVKGSGVGECWYLELPSVAMGRQLMAVRSKASSSQFINQFLLTKRVRFEDLASGNLIPGLARGDILDMVAPFPKIDEQERIAACLSSLDAQIAFESKQLVAFKSHKQGLMQQLFPAPEAASA